MKKFIPNAAMALCLTTHVCSAAEKDTYTDLAIQFCLEEIEKDGGKPGLLKLQESLQARIAGIDWVIYRPKLFLITTDTEYEIRAPAAPIAILLKELDSLIVSGIPFFGAHFPDDQINLILVDIGPAGNTVMCWYRILQEATY